MGMNKPFTLQLASASDVFDLVALHNATCDCLTTRYGEGHWSSRSTERGVLFHMKTSRVYIARGDHGLIATIALSTKKPWAIDKSYFGACDRPLYVTGMAVAPSEQRKGFGRLCISEARRIAMEWPADALRLDAYDAAAGAGEFYRKCGFVEVGRATYRGNPLIYFEMLL
jgi:GNAT superfamily N-acetyltransferase